MAKDTPFDIATCMWYAGIDPTSGKEAKVAQNMRKLQRALMQFFKPGNWFEVREALLESGRGDLIGNGCDALIPAQPPEAEDGEAAAGEREEQGVRPAELATLPLPYTPPSSRCWLSRAPGMDTTPKTCPKCGSREYYLFLGIEMTAGSRMQLGEKDCLYSVT